MRKDSRTDAPGGVSLVILLLIAGCGGGGGGGGTQALQYSGNTNQAAISGTNASKLTANVLGSDDAAVLIAGSSVESDGAEPGKNGGAAGLTRKLGRAFREAVRRAHHSPSAGGARVNETVDCDSGSIQTTGNLSDVDGTGTLLIRFRDCVFDGLLLSGEATAQVLVVEFVFFQGEFVPLPTDLTITTARLRVRGSGISSDAGGSFRVQTNVGGNTETITSDLVTLNNLTDGMTKAEGLMLSSQYDNVLAPTSASMSITGRIFDSVHGYVDVSTPAALTFSALPQDFPDSGQLLLTGAPLGGVPRTILVTAVDSRMVQLELDTDGVAGVDNTARLQWTELSGPVGADLADADMDGMHNSWETANMMNPNGGPADGTFDNDMDTHLNLGEYSAGSNPNDANSTPGNP